MHAHKLIHSHLHTSTHIFKVYTHVYTYTELYTNCNANHALWQVSRVYTLETHQWIFVGCNQTLSLSFPTRAHTCLLFLLRKTYTPPARLFYMCVCVCVDEIVPVPLHTPTA